jgi:integrase/recombinase XerD
MNLTTAILQYSLHQEARELTPSHRQECRRILGVLHEHLGDRRVDEITTEALERFLTSIRRRPGLKGRKTVSDTTLRAYYRTLASFFRFLEEREIIPKNPMRLIAPPKVKEELIRTFSDEQIERLFAEMDITTFTGLRDRAYVSFLLDTGCRRNEALGLTFDDLDLEGRQARVLGKGGKERVVFFGDTTTAWLERYLERRRESDLTTYVFISQDGTQLTGNAVTGRMAAYGKRAGIRGVRVSPHTLRHTFGVRWLAGDGDYKGDEISLQRILGHSSPVMTRRYAQLRTRDLGQLHRRLSPANRLVPPPPPEKHRRLR